MQEGEKARGRESSREKEKIESKREREKCKRKRLKESAIL